MRTSTAVTAVVLMLSTAASTWLSMEFDRRRKEATLEEVMWVTSPKMVRYLSLGNTGLAADIYWTRAVQYFGGKHGEKSMQYKLLRPLLELTTELDPNLLIAYYFGSFFLSQPPPEGAGDRDAAVQLVEKGIARNPDEWRLYYHLGMIHFLERKDYTRAAEAFERGAQHPKALPWMRVMAAAMRERGGDVNTARYLWLQTYENTEDRFIKDNAAKHLLALRVDQDVEQLERLVEQFRARHGRAPQSVGELVAAGLLPGTPVDPSGAPYVIRDGRVLVQDATPFPFITRGLKDGESPRR